MKKSEKFKIRNKKTGQEARLLPSSFGWSAVWIDDEGRRQQTLGEPDEIFWETWESVHSFYFFKK